MKGEVTVQLFDKDGKVVKEVKDHNMLTSFLRDCFRPLPFMNTCIGGISRIFSDEKYDIIHAYFGSIHVFSDALSEDADNYCEYGSSKKLAESRFDFSYSRDLSCYGNFNGSESGWDSPTVYKYVYDFPTNCANGRIAAIALAPIYASNTGKDISNYDTAITFKVKGNQEFVSNIDGNTQPYLSQAPFLEKNIEFQFFSVFRNKLYEIDADSRYKISSVDYVGATKKLKMHVYEYPFSKWFMREHIKGASYFECPVEAVETISVDITNVLNATAENYGFISATRDYVYVLCNGNRFISAGDTFYVERINLDTYEQTTISIRNTTGKRIKLGRSYNNVSSYSSYAKSSPMYSGCAMNDDYFLALSEDNSMYSIPLNDQISPVQILTVDGNEVANFITDYTAIANISGDVVFFDFNKDAPYNSGGQKAVNMRSAKSYDSFSIAKSEYPFSASWAIYAYCVDICNFYLYKSVGPSTDSKGRIYTWLNASNCMSTKYNLPTPVVKTADFSMKITYALDFSDEEEGGA